MSTATFVHCHRTRTKLRHLIDAANALAEAVASDAGRFPISPVEKRRRVRVYRTALAAYRGAE